MAAPPHDNDPPHVWRNFALNVLDGGLFGFAISLAGRSTVLPVFVRQEGGGDMAVGLIPVVWTLGFNMTQFALVGHLHPERSTLHLLRYTSLAQRLPWLLLVALAFQAARMPEPVVLTAFFGILALAAMGGSVNYPVWFEMIARTTPVRLRGRLFATRATLGSLLGIAAGGVTARVLDSREGDMSAFGLLFAIAICAMAVSYGCLLLLREPAPGGAAPDAPGGASLRAQARAVLAGDRSYRAFLAAEALVVVALLADAFLAVDAIRRFHLSEGYAGRFTVAVMVAGITASLLSGPVADRFGHRLNLVLAALSVAAACAVALAAGRVEAYYFAFAGTAAALALRNTSQLPILAELSAPAARPVYVALTSLLTAPFVLLGTVAGWASAHLGAHVVFVACGILAVASAAVLIAGVRVPHDPSVGVRVPHGTYGRRAQAARPTRPS